MHQKRRQFLIGLGAAQLALSVGFRPVSAQAPEKKAVADFPNTSNFRTGDLLWPKRRGAIVPRTRSLAAAPNLERREWRQPASSFWRTPHPASRQRWRSA